MKYNLEVPEELPLSSKAQVPLLVESYTVNLRLLYAGAVAVPIRTWPPELMRSLSVLLVINVAKSLLVVPQEVFVPPVVQIEVTLLPPELTLIFAPPVLFTSKAVPSKVKFASPFKLVPLPPVITLLSALFDIVALVPAAP